MFGDEFPLQSLQPFLTSRNQNEALGKGRKLPGEFLPDPGRGPCNQCCATVQELHNKRDMVVLNIKDQRPFQTKDGSQIRSILDVANAPVQHQSLAEARLDGGMRTQAHYHVLSEEFYYILEGSGEILLDGNTRKVGAGDAILIPPGCWHTITAETAMRFLCCCAPPYSHADTYFE